MLRVFALCLATLCASSAAAQSLVGKWDCQGRDGPGVAIRTLQEYRANGLFFHRANLAIGDTRGRMDASLSLRGSWSLKPNVIVENIRTAKLTKLLQNGKDISQTAIGRRMSRDLPKQLFGPTGTSKTRIKFTAPDRFEIVGGTIRGICARH